MNPPKKQRAKAQDLAMRISEDVSRLEEVSTQLVESLKLLKRPQEFEPLVFERLIQATAKELNDFYTGIETMIEKIIKFKIGQLPAGKSSHKELLILAKEQKIIDAPQHDFLRDLGQLRHFVRHAYGKELDIDTVKSGATQSIDQWPGIRDAMIYQKQNFSK